MATRNIVPRTGSEGSIGRNEKRWAHGYFVSCSADVVSASYLFGDGTGITGLPVGAMNYFFISDGTSLPQKIEDTNIIYFISGSSNSIQIQLTPAKEIIIDTVGLISSSNQLGSDISGSWTNWSASLSTRVYNIENDYLTSIFSSSISFRVTDTENSLTGVLSKTLLSSSEQIESNISGAFTSTSASIANRLYNIESDYLTTTFSSSTEIRITNTENSISNLVNKNLLSSSLQIALDISGSFNSTSSSLAGRIVNIESDYLTSAFSSSIESRLTNTENDITTIQSDYLKSSDTSSFYANDIKFISSPANLAFSGITAYSVMGENVVFSNILWLSSSMEYFKANAVNTNKMPGMVIALESGSSGQTKKILHEGYICFENWNWTPGGLLYVDTTAGQITQIPPSASGNQVQIIGYAIKSDTIYFKPNFGLVEIK